MRRPKALFATVTTVRWLLQATQDSSILFGVLSFPWTRTAERKGSPHLHFNGAQPRASFKSSERRPGPLAPRRSEQTSSRRVLSLLFGSDSQSGAFLAPRASSGGSELPASPAVPRCGRGDRGAAAAPERSPFPYSCSGRQRGLCRGTGPRSAGPRHSRQLIPKANYLGANSFSPALIQPCFHALSSLFSQAKLKASQAHKMGDKRKAGLCHTAGRQSTLTECRRTQRRGATSAGTALGMC